MPALPREVEDQPATDLKVLNGPLKTVHSHFADHMSYVDEEALVILKGHLLLEESLTQIIEKFVFHPQHIDRKLGFAQKIALARSMSLDESENRMWALIGALNKLRNQLAHSLDAVARQPRIDTVKSLYFDICRGMAGIEEHKTSEDKLVLAYAVAVCLGFISSLEQEIQRFRRFVDAIDWTINPHRHKQKATDR